MRARAGFVLSLLALVAAEAVVVAPPATAAGPTLPIVWQRDLGGSAIREASPALVDLTGSGQLDVVVGSRSGHLWGMRATNGSDAPGWPQWLAQPIDSTAAVADLDFDSRADLVIGSGSGDHPAGALWSLTRDGGVRFRRELGDNTFGAPSIFATPAIGDLEGDGRPDVAATTLGIESAWMLDGDGNPFSWAFPHFWDGTIHSSPALADVDGNGILDMVVGGDATPGGRVDHRGGMVRAIDALGFVLWEFRTDEIVRSSPSIGDLDRDGRPEVVFGTGDYYGGDDSTAVFALDLATGGLKWRRGVNGVVLSSPALSDIDGDGDLEVAFGTFPSNHGRGGGQFAYVLDGAGNDVPGFPHWVQSGALGSVTTADADGDGYQDLFVPTGAWVAVVSGRTGDRLYNLGENLSISYDGAPAIADVDRDGVLDVITVGTRHDGTGVVQRWQLPAQAKLGTYAWPQFRRDERRTGSWLAPRTGDVVGVARRPGGAGYWTVTSDGAVGARGGAPSFGSLAGTPLNQPVVGIAATPSGNGYWLVARDGGIFSFGDASFHGSTGGIRLNKAVVGMASTGSGQGYWLVAADGGLFTFGDAPFLGSEGHIRLNRPVVGMSRTPSGNGYWLVASDGGIFTHGDAPFHGSTGAVQLSRPITGMTPSPTGNGYAFVATDGGIFTFGDAPFHGSMGASPTPSPVMGMAYNGGGSGYWLVNAVGQRFGLGAATP